MAEGVEKGPKTGEFHARVELGPDALEGARVHLRRRLLDQMARRVGDVSIDGREYELVARIGKWEPADWPFEERLQVAFTFVLLDPLAAEIGEWVKDLPYRLPDCERTCILGEGYGEATGWLFQRGDLGWQRIK